MAIWRDEQGKPISIDECINALHSARSIMLKEMKFNPGITENAIAKLDFEKKYYILGKIIDAYTKAKKKTIKPKTGKKRLAH